MNNQAGISSTGYGGGIYATSTSSVIENNYFLQNKNKSNINGGAGMYSTAYYQGTITTANTIAKNVFVENESNGYGSGLWVTGVADAASRVSIDGNVFVNNKLGNSSYRGALYVDSNVKTITKNLFANNTINGNVSSQGADLELSGNNLVSNTFGSNKLQNAQSNYSSNVSGTPGFNSNTFNNTDNGGIVGSGYKVECDGSIACLKDPQNTGGSGIQKSLVGISSVDKQSTGWPGSVNGGALVLDSQKKGFVLTRVNKASDLGTDASLAGAFVYDITDKCFKFFDGQQWGCVTKSCDINIFQMLKDYMKSNN